MFEPPYPDPQPQKSTLLKRFVRGWHSWIHMIYEKSYTMKLGHVRLPRLDAYFANDLSLVNQIMTDVEGSYPKSDIFHKILSPLLGQSIFTTNGEVWQRQRRMMEGVFEVTKMRRVFP